MKSIKARKQKKAFFNAALHQRRKQLSSHLEENLLLKYDKRQVPLVKGDSIKIMRGAFKGHENKVTKIHLKKHQVEVEGVTITKADGKQVAKPVHPSNLLITKLNLTDKWRRKRLEEGLSSETKKEIEKEANIQLEELKEEERKAEEERLRQEKEAEEETIEPEAEQASEVSESLDERETQDTDEEIESTGESKEPSEEESKDASKNTEDETIEEKTVGEKKKKQADTKEEE